MIMMIICLKLLQKATMKKKKKKPKTNKHLKKYASETVKNGTKLIQQSIMPQYFSASVNFSETKDQNWF